MKTKLKQIVMLAAAFAASSLFAFDWDTVGDKVFMDVLTPSTPAGTVLQDNTCYHVQQDGTIDASELPGQSALKVPAGASVWINIASGKTLTVKGGHGSGQVPGGAGEMEYLLSVQNVAEDAETVDLSDILMDEERKYWYFAGRGGAGAGIGTSRRTRSARRIRSASWQSPSADRCPIP